LGAAKKVALKSGKTVLLGDQKSFPRFHSLRQQVASLAAIKSHQGRALFRWDLGNIDFDEVGIGNERLALVARNKIIQRDGISIPF
jgi:hypothetical protein